MRLGSFSDDPRSGLVYIFPARGLFLGGFFRLFGFLWHGSILQATQFPESPDC